MTPEYKKILFLTDLSKDSRTAFDHAVGLASRYGAHLIVMHVLEELTRTSSNLLTTYLGEEKWQKIIDSRKQDAQRVLIGKKTEVMMIKGALKAFCDDATEDLAECRFAEDDVDVVVSEGNVVEEILAEAANRNCDLIVMSYHVRGKIKGAVLGSTSQRLLRDSRIPVFLIPIKG